MSRSWAGRDDDGLGVLFEDSQWTYREFVAGCIERAWVFLDHRPKGDRPFHVGALLDNGPEYAMTLGGAALAGAAVVGINPTRRGAELARDITHADTGLIVTESHHRHILEGIGLDLPTFTVDGPEYEDELAVHRDRDEPGVDHRPARPVPAAVHERHDRPAQGRHLLAGPPGPHRGDPVGRRSAWTARSAATRSCRCSTRTR